MSWYNRIKYYYDHRLWTKGMVKNTVGKAITEEEYSKITDEIFEE